MVVNASDADVDSSLVYSIQTSINSHHSGMFGIHAQSGGIFLNKSLDYEEEKFFIFSVQAKDNHNTQQRIGHAVVQVNVKNVNDNGPKCTLENYVANVLPDITTGTLVLTVSANDIDSDALTYVLVDANGTTLSTHTTAFELNANTGEIRIRRPLTSSDADQFNLTVKVVDDGELYDECNVVIKEVSGNTPPVFAADTYVFSLKENKMHPKGEPVMQVTANDMDAGIAGEIVYKIITMETELPFTIDEYNGIIEQTGELNYEAKRTHTFLVRAADDGYPRRSASALVKIRVEDINEPPSFVITQYTATVSESTLPGQPILLLSYRDVDAGRQGDVTMALDGEDSRSFTIEQTTGALLLKEDLNFNVQNLYRFNISLRDEGTPSLASTNTAEVTVNVTNDLNNGPTFNSTRYVFHVLENSKGAFGKVHVLHDDTAPLVLQIISTDDVESVFNISNSGELAVIGTIDREQQRDYTFLIQVYQTTTPSATNRAVVTVHIDDVNDNKPAVSRTAIEETIPESTLAGSIIHVLQVSDADAQNDFNTNLVPKQEKFGLLRNGSTVMLILLKELDYEDIDIHQFSILITDDEFEENDVIVQVTIRVTDINEFGPIFGQSLYEINVLQNSSLDTILLDITATDSDGSVNNSLVTYSISPLTSDTPISLDSRTGKITQIGLFTESEKLVYRFTVIARDNGKPSISTGVLLIINIIPQNLNRPRFTQSVIQKSVAENSMVGLILLKFDVTDPDVVGKPMVFTIKAGNIDDHFEVLSDGFLRISKLIDREIISSFNLTVGVQDSGSPPLEAEVDAKIYITVLDQNDNSPVFVNSPNQVRILETQQLDEVIAKVTATGFVFFGF